MDAFRAEYPVIIEFPVHWGEMDAFQHVNNVAYFRYFESARIAYLQESGMLAEMEASGVGPILASTECRYRRPLTFPDHLLVGARVSEIQATGFVMEYGIYSQQQRTLATTGGGRIVMVDYRKGEKVPLPDTFAEALRNLEKRASRSL